jgi:Protein of unknown function (DUF2946)
MKHAPAGTETDLSDRGAKGMAMRSWRLRRIVTVWLGVFALLLQQHLSFGHLHVDRITSRAVATEHAAGKATAKGEQQTPSGPSDEDCPICATMMLLSAAGLLPAAPLVAGPAEFSQLAHQVFLERFSFSVSRHLLFHTRAPPLA